MRIPESIKFVPLVLTLAFVAAAAPLSFLPVGGPAMKVISDGKAATSTSLSVTLQSGTDVSLVFESHGLHGPGVELGPASMTTTPAVTLKAKEYVTVPIVVSGLTRFGTYHGTVEFREAKDKPGDGTIIPVTVVVRGSVVIPTSVLTAFDCVIPLSCSIGQFLAPTTQGVLINNQDGQEPAQPNTMSLMLRSAIGDSTITDKDLKMGTLPSILAGDSVRVYLAVPQDKVSAGHYDGYLRVGFQSGETISLPIGLDVRDAPLIAILLLALGIVFGRLLQAANTPTALAQQQSLTNLASLRSAASQLTDPDVTLLLEKKMADARKAIATMSADDQTIKQQVQDISTAIIIESNLEWIAANLNRIPAAEQPAVTADVTASRTALLSDDLATADASRKKAQGDLLTLVPAGALPAAMTVQRMQFDAILPPPPRRKRRERFASFVAGRPAHLLGGKHAFSRDLMFVALLVGLVIMGLFTLYTKNATFGSNRLFDYFGLAVWGLSADVAQRTLQGLQLPK